jgi:hypothetical protein
MRDSEKNTVNHGGSISFTATVPSHICYNSNRSAAPKLYKKGEIP